MRILVLSSRVPYPLVAGYCHRIYHVSKILASKYQVDLLAINESGIKVEELEEFNKIFNNIILFDYKSLKQKIRALLKIFTSKPIQVNLYYLRTIQDWINKHFLEYDLIYVNHIRMAEYLKGIPRKKVLDYHDAISMHYGDALKMATGFWKIFYSLENKKLLPYELEALEKFDKYFITSPIDKEYLLSKAANPANIEVIPMGVNEKLLNVDHKPQEEDWLVFLGKMDYYPNEDAVIYFTNEVFPIIKSQLKNLKFIIVGAYPSKKVQSLRKSAGVEVTGFVDDPYEYLERAKVVVAPIRLGAGIQNKILEAMALQKTVVTTSIGARGIAGGKDGKHFVVSDNPEEMAHAIIKLIKDSKTRKEIGQNARALIEDRYTWDIIGSKILSEIEKII